MRLIAVLLLAPAVCAAQSFDHGDWDRVVSRRVSAIGEVDYAALRAEFPDRIAAICIRLVAGSSRDDARFAALFGELPAGTWFLFEEPSELEGLLGTR